MAGCLRRRVRILVVVSVLLFIVVAASDSQGLTGPIPVFDVRFSPPLADISALNPDSKMLAVQLTPDGRAPAKVLSIDKHGQVETVDDLSAVSEITVPEGRLWITGESSENPVPGIGSGPGVRMPVASVQVFLAEGGGSYTVVYHTRGDYYELRHKDSHGHLLFIAAPKDGYGLKTVQTSYDGSRVLVVDESSLTAEGQRLGQRLYFYDSDGHVVADYDQGDELDNWLGAGEGLMAKDGSYFICARGRGAATASALVLFGKDGKPAWEKRFFKTHMLLEDYGGLFRVKGGNQSYIGMIDREGSLRVLERMGYGFDFWVSPGGDYAYLTVFKPFDVKRSGVPEGVKALFPSAKLVAPDINQLLPLGGSRPGVVIAPDGQAFVYYSFEALGVSGSATISYYDASLKKLWEDRFYSGDVSPQFVDGSRGFILKFGYPATRLIYYEAGS